MRGPESWTALVRVIIPPQSGFKFAFVSGFQVWWPRPGPVGRWLVSPPGPPSRPRPALAPGSRSGTRRHPAPRNLMLSQLARICHCSLIDDLLASESGTGFALKFAVRWRAVWRLAAFLRVGSVGPRALSRVWRPVTVQLYWAWPG